MKLSELDYDLPAGRIAQHPTPQRDASRLLVLSRHSNLPIEHATFRDIDRYLSPPDILVLNDTRVLPARLIGRKQGGGRIELLLVEPATQAVSLSEGETWLCLAGFNRPPAAGARLDMGSDLEAWYLGPAEGALHRVLLKPVRIAPRGSEGGARRSAERGAPEQRARAPETAKAKESGTGDALSAGEDGRTREAGHWRASEAAGDDARPDAPARAPGGPACGHAVPAPAIGPALRAALERTGRIPLPPYIERAADALDANEGREDAARYQTVYAEKDGAIAAPTAGLHFTKELLGRLEQRGIVIARITLHVGPATFLPVRTESVEDHPMSAERYEVSTEAAQAIGRARALGGRIVAVGTTVVRALESGADGRGGVLSAHGRTDLFIQPGYRFRAVDALVTNFHLPRSTLLALVCAFAGRERILDAYREAIAAGYRFYSYGDAMLIL